MLNVSTQSINHRIKKDNFKSFKTVRSFESKTHAYLARVIVVLLVAFILVLFLPWTQNVRAIGNVIALKPEQRPQSIQSIIGGRIEKWHVVEGQFVEKGDTILTISEIKDAYFDPNILTNTRNQIEGKTVTKEAYGDKISQLKLQVQALEQAMILYTEQARNKIIQNQLKVTTDSTDLVAAEINQKIAEEQYLRIKALQKEGLRSLTDLENRELKMQEANAKLISQKNKLLTSRNELINAKIELGSIQASYAEKIAKSNSEIASTASNISDTDVELAKLDNQFANYKIRRDNYFVLAPQNGYVTKAITFGIGETIKEGTPIVTIMPEKYDLAVEMFVKPIDLPLFEAGQKVMIQFDGWPAVIFSGWPGVSFGTYEGTVLAIDNFISDNMKYRILVKPRKGTESWPAPLRVGAGVKTITLLKNVPVWYEMWRQVNGFPPDYYKKKPSQLDPKK